MTYLGIDIGGTNIEFGILDQENNILFQNSFKTKSFDNLNSCCEAIFNDLESNNFTKLTGIGIGAPSLNFHTQQIESAPNLNWEEPLEISKVFEAKFNCPVKSINDASAAIVGEWISGGAKGLDNFAMITLGTGVGIGLIINNQVYHGANGTGGEFGHFSIHRHNGRECGCGNFGCLETYLGINGILTTAKQKIEFSTGPSKLHKITPSELSVRDIFKFARKEDPVALEIVDNIAADLAYGISMLANSLDLNNVFLFGGIAKEGNYLRKKTQKEIIPLLTGPLKQSFNLKTSELLNENPAIIGAVHILKTSL